jgi:hypothetical protein
LQFSSVVFDKIEGLGFEHYTCIHGFIGKYVLLIFNSMLV